MFRSFLLLVLTVLFLPAPCLGQWRDPYFEARIRPWVYDVDRSGGVWAGVDHPYHQPTLPFERPRSPERALEEVLREGDRARSRGDLAGARRDYLQALQVATRSWGEGCDLARAARERLTSLETEEGPPPEGTGESLSRTLEVVRRKLARGRRFREETAPPAP